MKSPARDGDSELRGVADWPATAGSLAGAPVDVSVTRVTLLGWCDSACQVGAFAARETGTPG
jgi:hypothetical protein